MMNHVLTKDNHRYTTEPTNKVIFLEGIAQEYLTLF